MKLQADTTPPFDFDDSIKDFNTLYRLPMNVIPSTTNLSPDEDYIVRLARFKETLLDEISEIDEIIDDCEPNEVKALVAIADLLCDIQIYCASEMRKFGLPNSAILRIIMESNMSKLGADGKPIYNDAGKVMKGPGYWKPEPKIQELIEALRE